MNTAQIEQTLLAHIQKWEHFNTVVLARENRNFKPPKSLWGRVTILGGVNTIRSVSDEPCILQQGTLVIQLFAPENVGTAEIKHKADSLANHLKAKQFGKLETLAPSVINVGFNEFYQINVSVPWRYY
ncbi:phage tail terminator-like protein [Moraxella catarrhalis]|uniref:phage tail terminator-like protein n=1 Tax=Moraxella catarrhalis TaxID=480 RepID=UPI00128C27EB|nr:phage tail terminator-like protein [Moraxella catarrhalis]MPW46779.1 hypothetical protein [Moraxella catarrhalis]MPW48919.1 hypothetical protein [Moraxella catarrhalis]